jgi:hypothetical protein
MRSRATDLTLDRARDRVIGRPTDRKISRSADSKIDRAADDSATSASYGLRVSTRKESKMKHLSAFVAAAVLAGLALASSGAAAGRPTLEFLSVNRSNVLLGVDGSDAPKVGSRLLFVDTMYNRVAQLGKPAGARVGHAEGVCTVVSAGAAQCTITAHVPNGELVSIGTILLRNGPTVEHYAVVGGAGAYGSAHGTVTARSISESKTLVSVDLAA